MNGTQDRNHKAPDFLFQKHARSNNMILDWFNAEEAVLFAQEIVREINLLFPPEHQKGKAIPAKVYQKKFGNLIDRTRIFAAKHNLNIYKKAKLLNTVKWEMREAGHEDDFTDKVVVFLAPLLHK
ncbi:MAG: hypothetical protein OEV15_06315 [Gallionella sp.]|nr:hypothetical protein [Gallionella sp.]